MREKLQRFMQGRYGQDQLSRFMLVVTLIMLLLSTFTRAVEFNWFAILLLVISYLRIFSRNIPKRAAENRKYLQITAGIRSRFAGIRSRMHIRRDSHIYTCPHCRQKIRVPRGKGKIEIRCPRCSETFVKRS